MWKRADSGELINLNFVSSLFCYVKSEDSAEVRADIQSRDHYFVMHSGTALECELYLSDLALVMASNAELCKRIATALEELARIQ